MIFYMVYCESSLLGLLFTNDYLWAMNWEDIIGQDSVKHHLKAGIADNRVSHAQLFLGKSGYGTLPLALAYAQEILCRENAYSASKVAHFNHLDLHFSFPVFKGNGGGLSKYFYDDFRNMVMAQPYASYEDWSSILDSDNKQLTIYSEEIDDLNERFNLKSFEGGTKVLIMWCANKMNDSAANKFLKFLEEPPDRTLIILIADSYQDFLKTILSRVQVTEIPRLSEADIIGYLSRFDLPQERCREIAFQSQGDLNTAYKLYLQGDVSTEFEELFVQWVREAFQVKRKPEMLKNIVFWARNIAGWNKEKQKKFLDYCAQMFRLALMQNYGAVDLVYQTIKVNKFNWERFSDYVHGANIEDILQEITQADYHLQRNANAKIVWTDMGIKLSRYLHRSPK